MARTSKDELVAKHLYAGGDKQLSRHQAGHIWRSGDFWYGRWREDVLDQGQVVRKQRSAKLAKVCDRFRTKTDVRPLLAEKLRPINEHRTQPEGTLPVAEFVENFYLPFVQENFKPSTIDGYKTLWELYLAPHLKKIVIRDFRTVNAANLLADIHRRHKLGRTTLKHIKSFLSGVFSYAKNQGAFDAINPVQDAMIPKSAGKPSETHAATPDEVLAMIDALDKAGERKASAAIALMFFTGLRPGEARGICWEDFDGKRLSVHQSIWHTYTTTPKTEESSQPVPVIELLRAILSELRALDNNPTSGPILRGPSGRPLDLHNLANRAVIPTLKNANIPWHGWYALRRGIATLTSSVEHDPMAAKGLLRHSSVSTTLKHYIKDIPEATQRAMDKIEALLGDGSKPQAS